MAPPEFSNFGQDCADLFDNHHASNGLGYKHAGKMACGGDYELNLHNATGEKEVTWDLSATLGACNCTYDSTNTLSKSIEFTVKQVEGLKLKWDCNFNAATGLNLGTIKSNFSNEKINANLTSTLDKSPALDFDASVALPVGAVGISGSFDVGQSALGDIAWGLHHSRGNTQVAFKADNVMNPLNGNLSVFNKLPGNKDFCCYGVNANTATGALSLAAATSCSSKNTMRYKLEHTGRLHAAHVQRLNSRAALTLSANLNLKDLAAGGHKFGAGLSFE